MALRIIALLMVVVGLLAAVAIWWLPASHGRKGGWHPAVPGIPSEPSPVGLSQVFPTSR